MSIVNSNEQVHFKYRTITPQSTTDDSGHLPDGRNQDVSAEREKQTAVSAEDTA